MQWCVQGYHVNVLGTLCKHRKVATKCIVCNPPYAPRLVPWEERVKKDRVFRQHAGQDDDNAPAQHQATSNRNVFSRSARNLFSGSQAQEEEEISPRPVISVDLNQVHQSWRLETRSNSSANKSSPDEQRRRRGSGSSTSSLRSAPAFPHPQGDSDQQGSASSSPRTSKEHTRDDLRKAKKVRSLAAERVSARCRQLRDRGPRTLGYDVYS